MSVTLFVKDRPTDPKNIYESTQNHEQDECLDSRGLTGPTPWW
jgi:hypothetical protein